AEDDWVAREKESVVLLPDVVGVADVLQHTPIPVIASPPPSVTVPPETAVVYVRLVAASVVDTVGAVAMLSLRG
ncbi:MAG: hypothetical protein M0R06_22290, partial [Sphaerochaeta sp.]|nr:hypothetical protein [Sphaerochaeta sp.]